MSRPRLYLNHIADFDCLIALEFGRVDDAQPPGNRRGVSESFGFLHDGPEGPALGFKILGFSTFDPEDSDVEEIWGEPRFDVLVLGLGDASSVRSCSPRRRCSARRTRSTASSSTPAIDAEGEEALGLWLAALQAGDSMPHFGLGYTLYELDRFPEAYRHLRHYTEIAPCESWNWCWLGMAAEAVGEDEGARAAYSRAIEIERDLGDDETDAQERLEAMGPRAISESGD